MLNRAQLRVPGQLESIHAGGAGFGEDGGHLRQLLHRGGGADAFVGAHYAAIFQCDGHHGGEPPLLAGAGGPLLTGKGDSVGVGAADTVQCGNEVRPVTHHQHAALGGELRIGEHAGLV